MFLMRRILGWDEPAGAPPLRELDALSFGSLLHRVVEVFYRANGEAFVAGARSTGHFRKVAFELADRLFEEFLSEYPLVGAGVREKERERLRDALGAFLDDDRGRYRGRDRRFVGVEVAFGEDPPLEVDAGGVTLHLRGFIDRLDVVDGVTLVRDLKSGKAHPKRGDEAGPTPFRDVQLGVYALATRKLAARWHVPRRLAAAYVYASGRGEVEERAFRDDFQDLEAATAEWLATAGQLLAARAFPPTPDANDCRYCPFAPVCGDHAVARARDGLEGADGPLGRFGALKLGDEDEEDEG
jgi:RecB family exonuclease